MDDCPLALDVDWVGDCLPSALGVEAVAEVGVPLQLDGAGMGAAGPRAICSTSVAIAGQLLGDGSC